MYPVNPNRTRRGDGEEAMMGCVTQIVGFMIYLIIAGAIGGTFRTPLSYHMTAPGPAGVSAEFRETQKARHFIGGLAQGEMPRIERLVSKHVRPEDTLTDLSVRTRHTVGDTLLTIVTLGVYAPMTVDVEGRYTRPPKSEQASVR